jgi:hypothetical protein
MIFEAKHFRTAFYRGTSFPKPLAKVSSYTVNRKQAESIFPRSRMNQNYKHDDFEVEVLWYRYAGNPKLALS